MLSIKKATQISNLAEGLPAAMVEVTNAAKSLKAMRHNVTIMIDKYQFRSESMVQCNIDIEGLGDIWENDWDAALTNLRSQIAKKYPLKEVAA